MSTESLTISALAEAYGSGKATPRAIAETIAARAAQHAESNIWITPPSMDLMEPYLARLEAMDEEGRAAAPLWGIPFAVKDNIDLAGVPTTAACPEYAYTPSESATVVRLLVEAGAFPVGKTNLDQFATGLVGTRSPYGECRNALKPELISGGSSSGSAVSVALGMASFALGTDTAGSGRVPAALNNLIGFKPALGKWSTKGVVPACASLDCVTVFANNLTDALAVDAVASKPDTECAWSKRYDAEKLCFPGTVYVPAEEPEFYGPYEKEYRAAWRKALARIECVTKAQGSRVEPIDTAEFSKIAAILYDGPWVAERWSDLGSFVEEHGEAVFPVTKQILESGNRPDLTAADLFQTLHQVTAMRAKCAQLFDDAIMIMPTAGGTFTREQVDADPIATNSQMGLYTNHCNLSDLGAIAVPAGWAADDVPFGITAFTTAKRQCLTDGFAWAFLEQETVEVAVCGQHMRGLVLHGQLEELGAVFLEGTRTAPSYKLFALPTEPVKPGLAKTLEDGSSITVETYLMTAEAFGKLAATTPAPLGFGTIELEDGRQVKGFLAEPYALKEGGVEEITGFGSFKAWLA